MNVPDRIKITYDGKHTQVSDAMTGESVDAAGVVLRFVREGNLIAEVTFYSPASRQRSGRSDTFKVTYRNADLELDIHTWQET
ncbi:MAG TPA: hypothetical protein VGP82_06560 [Ktedonobacterales bacterium]|jgi:hypothetical protein|nr:hypothetical protein [Ktedonobacterales bacterium]